MASTKSPDAVATYLKLILSKKVGTEIATLGTPCPLEGVPVPPALVNQYEILKVAQAMPARAGLTLKFQNIWITLSMFVRRSILQQATKFLTNSLPA